MTLTPSQVAAVEHDGRNLQIIACAGSGKTEVVARRVARLLRTGMPQGLRPANIVAFTFTEKAAAELKDRIVGRIRAELGEVPGLAELYVGTIHAFCLELIKTEMPKYLKYEVLNDVQRILFVDRNSNRSGLGTSCTLDRKQLRRYVDTKVYCRALDTLREDTIHSQALEACSVARSASLYDGLLDEKGYLDYSSILAIAARELEGNAELRARLAGRVRHLIVDEYQDVNPVQERIVRVLHDLGASLSVVGDDDQTIYQWRGSRVRNIVDFESRYPEVTPIRLEENFRSSPAIVEIAREFIARNPGRLRKSMRAAADMAYGDGDVLALGFPDPSEEAAFIVRKIRELHGHRLVEGGTPRGLSYSDVAILLRSVSKNGAVIVDALKQAGIPHVVIGLTGLFASDEAKAARTTFFWLADRPGIDEDQVLAAWKAADLGLEESRVEAGMSFLRTTRQSLGETEGARWSRYSLQRTYLTLLEKFGLTESSVPGGRGEVVFYNLGKFSQVISDFEEINFHSSPPEKYRSFAGFLEHQADGAYEEGGVDAQRASPDAVRIMTVHQSKGMQWPAVFLPALLRNRFPSAAVGGRNVWHLLPKDAVADSQRYLGGIEDERRLFYVAVTRAQKFLFMTHAPIPGNQRAQAPSEFYLDVLASPRVKRYDVPLAGRPRVESRARRTISSVVLSFSDLKYFFECPYQFKLRVLYGFNAPIDEALGYGKSLHDCLAEVHARAMRGDCAQPAEAAVLVQRHLRAPFAYPALRDQLQRSAEAVVADYLRVRQDDLAKIEHFEKGIELDLGDGISVVGRIDLVRRNDTGQTAIVDLKSSGQAQEESLTEKQLHIYALGYQQLTGRSADLVEIYHLDRQARQARAVDQHFIEEVKTDVARAAQALRLGEFPAIPSGARCGTCDQAGLCADCRR